MNEKPAKNGGNGGIDQIYATSLNEVKNDIDEALRAVSAEKSKQWGIDIQYLPHKMLRCNLNKILHYKINRLCDNCVRISACKNFEQISRAFMKYGYVVFPYMLYIERIHSKRIPPEKLSSFGAKVKGVLFIASFSFDKDFEDDPEYSALNNTYHELCKTLPDDVIQQHILPCIPMDDFERFVAITNLNDKLLRIYGRKELIPKYEAVIRYICNNADTRCLLEALYRGDEGFQPPVKFMGLFKAMKWVMGELVNY